MEGTAFSYTPLLRSYKFDGNHIEFPPKNSKLQPQIMRIVNDRREELVERQFAPSRSLHLSNESLDTAARGSVKKAQNTLNHALDELTDQVFVGMVSMQYQACQDFVRLVEQLEHACIRFVHFSRENELRSRVFSEKMGLESGWNCHISLRGEKAQGEAHRRIATPPVHLSAPATRCQTVTECYYASDKPSLGSCRSVPSLVMQLTSRAPSQPAASAKGESESGEEQVLFALDDTNADAETENSTRDEEFESIAFDMANRAKLPRGIKDIRPHLETVDNVPLQVSLFTDCTPELTQEMIKVMQEYGEIVCVVGSASSKLNTCVFLQANASIAVEPLDGHSCAALGDDFETLVGNGSGSDKQRRKKSAKNENRACSSSSSKDGVEEGEYEGLENEEERAHSCSSLYSYTRSTSESISEDSNSSNSDSCIELNRCKSALVANLPRPSALASLLASFPCSYNYSRGEPVDLHGLIMEARHFTFKMKNTFVCMICFALSVSSAQFLASILFMPPMFSSGLTIWLTVVVIPMLSFSLMGTTMDSQVMKMAVGKNLQLTRENIVFFVVCYLIKFIPSIIVVVLNFGLIIAHSCKLTGFGSSSLGPCWMFTYVRHHVTTNASTLSPPLYESRELASNNSIQEPTIDSDELLWSTHLLAAQVCSAFLVVLYFVVISAGFVHRSHLMWQRSPLHNYFWVCTSLSLLIVQFLCSQLVLRVSANQGQVAFEFLSSLPLHIWIVSFSWPALVTGINLVVKRAEVKATIRQQRRARFDFNTKLGMNSPF